MHLTGQIEFQGAQKISLPITQHKVLTVKQILSNFPNMDRVDKGPKEIFSPDIQKDLLLLEEQEGSVNFKFGVIYMKHGQSSDDDILSNGNLHRKGLRKCCIGWFQSSAVPNSNSFFRY
jgi:hypothetical protein